MTKFQTWWLKRLAKHAVIQGDHHYKIVEFYSVLIEAARDEFFEDNKITFDRFLQKCHQDALNRKPDVRYNLTKIRE
jgi:hypothetical protein